MVDELKPNIHIIKGNGVTINVYEPTFPRTSQDADVLCRKWHSEGWHCGIIYMYSNRKNGKKYIGQTTRPANRHKNHKTNWRNAHPEGVFAKSVKRYGEDWFDYQVLDIFRDKNEQHLHSLLDKYEKFYIEQRNASTKKYGYNVAAGGWALPKENPTEKAVDMFDLNGNYIRTFQSLSDAKAFINVSGPTIRQVCNHKHYTAGGYLWAWRGQQPVLPPEIKKVYAYNEDGQFVAEYENVFVAAKALHASSAQIDHALKDKYRLGCQMYWRRYKTEQIPLSDFPKAIYAYDLDGNFVKGFINLTKAKVFTNDTASSSISHAIGRNTAHKGYLWRTFYADKIDPTDGRFVNKVAVTAIFPDGSQKHYDRIIDAAQDTGTNTGGIHRSMKRGNKTAKGIRFIRE